MTLAFFHLLPREDEGEASPPEAPPAEAPASGGGGGAVGGDNALQREQERASERAERALERQGFETQVAGLQTSVNTLGDELAAALAPPPPAAPAPAPAPAYPIPPAQQQAIEAGVPPGPGGVVPYEGEHVRVGPKPSAVEHTFATKAVRRK